MTNLEQAASWSTIGAAIVGVAALLAAAIAASQARAAAIDASKGLALARLSRREQQLISVGEAVSRILNAPEEGFRHRRLVQDAQTLLFLVAEDDLAYTRETVLDFLSTTDVGDRRAMEPLIALRMLEEVQDHLRSTRSSVAER